MLPKLILRRLFLAALFAGCTTPPLPQFAQVPLPSPPPATPTLRVDSETVLPWASEEPVLIVVDKGCRTLNLYQYGRLTRSYPVVIGRQPGRKLYEGDQRTPTGLYMIIGKDHHKRWTRFMLLDYPSEQDIRRYWQNISAGTVPRRGDSYAGIGGAIGIHGTDREAFNRAGINWTLGCISLLNPDVQELDTFVPVGTPVYIRD